MTECVWSLHSALAQMLAGKIEAGTPGDKGTPRGVASRTPSEPKAHATLRALCAVAVLGQAAVCVCVRA